MPAKKKGWSAKLARPIGLKDGATLDALEDVRAFILKRPITSKSASYGGARRS